jgi:hypothetical protein
MDDFLFIGNDGFGVSKGDNVVNTVTGSYYVVHSLYPSDNDLVICSFIDLENKLQSFVFNKINLRKGLA